jgi:hypothetical protein
MTFHAPLILRWDIQNPKPLPPEIYNKVIQHIKKVNIESKEQRGYRDIKLDHFYLENNCYYFLCLPDVSYSALDIINIFDILREPNRWSVLDNFTYEPTKNLSYCFGIVPHYRLSILESKYHSQLHEFLVRSCIDLNLSPTVYKPHSC